MAAAAGLLDLNEPMFGLSKVEVVQSIDPTKLQVSLDDCDLLSMQQAQQHLLNRLAGLAAGRLMLLVGNIALQHPVALGSCPPQHLDAIGASWQAPACSRAGATPAGDLEVDNR